MKYQPIRGTTDVFALDAERDHFVLEIARKQAKLFGFSEIRTPIFESLDIFQRTLGESSDIVHKEMYVFQDRSGHSLVLRPEGTAPVVRALLHSGLHYKLPQKFFYTGPMFRYERPQKGRARQFHQIGVECFGVSWISAELDVIALANTLLKSLGVSSKLHINYLGTTEERTIYMRVLSSYFQTYRSSLSSDSQRRLDFNVLRILDSKDLQDQDIIHGAPKMIDFLHKESDECFQALCDGLHQMNILYTVDPFLVRGLDYYTGVVFEFISDDLGAQSTILAGGRYDTLASQLTEGSVSEVPAVGWAAGVERLRFLCDSSIYPTQANVWIIVWLEQEDMCPAMKLAHILRHHGLIVHFSSGGSLKKQLKQASRLEANYAIIVGANERDTGLWTVRDMRIGVQEKMTTKDICTCGNTLKI